MKKTIAASALLAVTAGCTTGQKNTLPAGTSRLLPEPDLKERLLYQKTVTDTFFSRSTGKLVVLAKLRGREKPVRTGKDQRPEDAEVVFELLSDSTGRICRISESSYSDSGDWSVVYSHYFDPYGNTFAHERRVSAFNTHCPDARYKADLLTTKIIVRLFNPYHQLIDSTYRLTDPENNDLRGKKCQQEAPGNLSVFNSIEDYT